VHTLKIIAGGFLLLGAFLLVGHYWAGTDRGAMRGAAKYFIPVWLAIAGINMWLGVSRAGYTVRDEAPIFLLVFAVPVAVALLVLWRS
jgi:hypothetical protein